MGEGEISTLDRLHARLAGRARVRGALVVGPEAHPPSWDVGSAARGRQLVEGAFRLAGHPVRSRGRSIWEVPAPIPELAADGGPRVAPRAADPAFEAARHGFGWLFDLAALGSEAAHALARDWTDGWIARHGRGAGPGWTPALTGRRLIALIDHAEIALGPAPGPEALRALARQAVLLRRRWRAAPPGGPRIEALAGLIRAAVALEGFGAAVGPAADALAAEAARMRGVVPSRSPEDLLDRLALLASSAEALAGAGHAPPPALSEAMASIAPTLRALRHADGGLARFHGGGRGAPGRLDRALAASGARVRPRAGPTPWPPPAPRLAMGFARLRAGRVSVIVDAAPPPEGSAEAHASTLALEMTSGRRPIVVSCGPGASFGPAWRRAGRATASHSTLDLEGLSSSRTAPGGGPGAALVETPREVRREQHAGPDGQSLKVSHDGWRATHGLTHARELDLAPDGARLSGEDTLAALTDRDARRFEAALERLSQEGIAGGLAWRLRFHLRPDAAVRLASDGAAAEVALSSGEAWRFEHDGAAELRIDPSVHLEPARARPARASQIVLTLLSEQPVSRMRWRLFRVEPTAPRDHAPPAEEGEGPADAEGADEGR